MRKAREIKVKIWGKVEFVYENVEFSQVTDDLFKNVRKTITSGYNKAKLQKSRNYRTLKILTLPP
jgi:hypothetical protein